MKKIFIILLTAGLFSGCMTTEVMAPKTKDYKLADANDQLDQSIQFREVYILWGLINLSEDKIAEHIENMDAEVIKITVSTSFIDFLINMIGSAVSVRVQTVTIEGGREVTVITTDPEIETI